MSGTKIANLSFAEEENVIKNRFLTQASVPRGEPPFKKLARKYVQLCEAADKGTVEQTEKELKDLMREVSLFETQAQKLTSVCDANRREQQLYVEKQQRLQEEIEQAKADIEAKKRELQEAKITRQHNDHYEVLRGIVVQHPSRAATQAEIDRITSSIQKIQAEGAKYDSMLQRRRKQFALLFHVLDELQRLGDDNGAEGGADEGAGGAAGGAAALQAAGAQGEGDAQGMDVDS